MSLTGSARANAEVAIHAQPNSSPVFPEPEVISRQFTGRLAAILVIVSGLTAMLSVLTPDEPLASWQLSVTTGILAIVLGVIAWFLPWYRWSRRRSLWLVPPSLAVVALGNVADPNPYTYSLVFPVIFLWVGLAHPRGTSLRLLPLLAVAFAVPLLVATNTPPYALSSLAYVAAVCLLAGEAVAWVTEHLRKLEVAVQKGRTEARFQTLVQRSSDVVAIVDEHGTFEYVSPSVAQVLKRNPEDLVGTSLLQLLEPENIAPARALLKELPLAQSSSALEWRVKLADGWCHLETIATNLLHDPDVRGIVLNSRDITERKAFEAQLAHHAFHDPLTGLPNRALFLDRIAHAQKRARRDGAQIAVLYLDLDDFKSLNDRLGNAVGDLLLIALAQRLQATLRESETIARFGADEFGVLVEDNAVASRATEIADRCLAECRKPFSLGEHDVPVEMSVGVAFGRPGLPADDLLREADVAMSAAKARGKNCVDIFDIALGARTRERLQLELDLQQALPRGELRVYYQPVISLEDGSIEGVEALVRWEHPQRGLVMPAEFIPIAEETGLIVPIGQWVLEQACAQVHAWRRRRPRYASLGVSVNLSARQFQRSDLVTQISRSVHASGLDPRALTLEITESVVMADPAVAAATLNELKLLGFAVSIDDFGTGYSSLSYLKHFPIDNLKIDRSFVDGLGSDDQDTAIVRSIVDLAQALHVTITAEGIETTLQHTALRTLGCEWGQGYLFARPIPATEIEALLDERPHEADLPLAA